MAFTEETINLFSVLVDQWILFFDLHSKRSFLLMRFLLQSYHVEVFLYNFVYFLANERSSFFWIRFILHFNHFIYQCLIVIVFYMNQFSSSMSVQLTPRQQSVLNLFRNFNYSRNSVITKPQLTSILDSVSRKKLEHEFPRDLLNEIWGEAQTLSKGQTTVFIVTKIIVEADGILVQRIQMINEGLPYKQGQLTKLKVDLQTRQAVQTNRFENNYAITTLATEQMTALSTQIDILHKDKVQFEKQRKFLSVCFESHQLPPEVKSMLGNIFTQIVYPEREMPELSSLFWLAMVCILLQMAIIDERQAQFSLTMCLLSVGMLFVGYVSTWLCKLTMGGILLSLVLDGMALFLRIDQQYYMAPERRLGSAWINVIFGVLLVASMLLRIVVLGYLCPLSSASQTGCFFMLFGHKLVLKAVKQ